MFSIKNRTKRRLPQLPWAAALSEILGERYELSLVICGDTLIRNLNKKHRGKDRPTNVLSFPLDRQHGEIFLDWPCIIREAPNFDRTVPEHALDLFIHGLLHLKGHDHGSRMESLEKYFISRLNDKANRHRVGYRNRFNKSGGGGA